MKFFPFHGRRWMAILPWYLKRHMQILCGKPCSHRHGPRHRIMRVPRCHRPHCPSMPSRGSRPARARPLPHPHQPLCPRSRLPWVQSLPGRPCRLFAPTQTLPNPPLRIVRHVAKAIGSVVSSTCSISPATRIPKRNPNGFVHLIVMWQILVALHE